MKIQNLIIILAFLALVVAGLTASYMVVKNIEGQETQSSATPHVTQVQSIPPNIETSSQISPDGTKLLSMQITLNANKTKTIEFTTTDEDNSNRKKIYTAFAKENETYTLPFNAWSPDNKYVFIFKNGQEALVFMADGEPILEDKLYLDIPKIFAEKIKEYFYKETTGWASNNLLIVNTVKQDSSKGPSFWFEVPSKAIIQLSSQF